MLAALLTLLSKASLKDWAYTAIISVLLVAFGWYTHHERVIGAQQEVAKVVAVQKANRAKVDAINAHNQRIEDQTNEEIKGLSTSLAAANAGLTSRMRNDTSSNRSVIVPEASCPAIEPANDSAAQSGTGSPSATVERASIDSEALKDDLQIALDHNLQLQAIEQEFQSIKK